MTGGGPMVMIGPRLRRPAIWRNLDVPANAVARGTDGRLYQFPVGILGAWYTREPVLEARRLRLDPTHPTLAVRIAEFATRGGGAHVELDREIAAWANNTPGEVATYR